MGDLLVFSGPQLAIDSFHYNFIKIISKFQFSSHWGKFAVGAGMSNIDDKFSPWFEKDYKNLINNLKCRRLLVKFIIFELEKLTELNW